MRWVVADAGKPIAWFVYESDARRYAARCGTRHFTVYKEGE